MKNTHAILLLAVFVGIATDLGLVGSQSYLLSQADAVWALYGAIISGTLFTWFQRAASTLRIKFAKFGVWCFMVYATVVFSLSREVLPPFPQAIAWYMVSFFGFYLSRWIVTDLARRHLPPATANSYFSFLNAFFEGGMLFVLVTARVWGLAMTPPVTMGVIAICTLLAGLLVGLRFFSAGNPEIHYSHTDSPVNPAVAEGDLKPLVWRFAALAAVFALIEVNEEYLIKIVVKETFRNYDAIRATTEIYFALSCAFIVVFSSVTAWGISTRRVSPLTLLRGQVMLMAALCLACFTFRSFYLFAGFEIFRRVAESCLYQPSLQIILGSLPADQRNRLRTGYNLVFNAAIPLGMAAIFSFSRNLSPTAESGLAMGFILAAIVGAFILIGAFGRRFTALLYRLAASDWKSAAIVAAHALSYIRPLDYVARMREVLEGVPKKLLRKTIIIGLGYTHSDDAVALIKKEFASDKEELQIAAIDALRVSHRHDASQLLVNILQGRAKPKTNRVKVNAMRVIGAVFGRGAIPFLLNGLDDDDSRVVANTLEVLAFFRDPELIGHFIKFSTADNPRVKANALIGLAQFRQTRAIYRDLAERALAGRNPEETASVLYALGKMNAREFRPELARLFAERAWENPRLINPLAWAMLRTGLNEGYRLTDTILAGKGIDHHEEAFMHYFSQHDQEIRYELISRFLKEHHGDPETVEHFGAMLKRSVFDFHAELEYLEMYGKALMRI